MAYGAVRGKALPLSVGVDNCPGRLAKGFIFVPFSSLILRLPRIYEGDVGIRRGTGVNMLGSV